MNILIIGGGIIGLTICRELASNPTVERIVLIEQEKHVAVHASGRNSGVLHAGFYYPSGTSKAEHCVIGNRLLRRYAADNSLPIKEVGKLVVATDSEEEKNLQSLFQRGLENGCTLDWVGSDEIKQFSPYVRDDYPAIYSPMTAVSDPLVLARHLEQELISIPKVTIRRSTRFVCLKSSNTAVVRIQDIHEEIPFDKIVVCAGCWSAEIASVCGVEHDYCILPFKGIYLKSESPSDLLSKHIYPVPDPAFPFLGVHTTNTIDGYIKIGPTAIPAYGPRNYKPYPEGTDLKIFSKILKLQARMFLGNVDGFRSLSLREIQNYYMPNMLKQVNRMLNIRLEDYLRFGWSEPGLRAQLVNKNTGSLVYDYIHILKNNQLHILNAVSPSWSSAFSLGSYYASLLIEE